MTSPFESEMCINSQKRKREKECVFNRLADFTCSPCSLLLVLLGSQGHSLFLHPTQAFQRPKRLPHRLHFCSRQEFLSLSLLFLVQNTRVQLFCRMSIVQEILYGYVVLTVVCVCFAVAGCWKSASPMNQSASLSKLQQQQEPLAELVEPRY